MPRPPGDARRESDGIGSTRYARLSGGFLALTLLVLAGASPLSADRRVSPTRRGGERPTADLVTVVGTVTIEELGSAAEAVIYLEGDGGATRPLPASDRRVVVDQKGLRFVPHVLAIPVGTSVEFSNSDAVLHNIFAPGQGGETFDLGTWPKGEVRSYRFDHPGVSVLLCKVHPEMEAYIVVVPTSLYAVSNATGEFRMSGVPPGAYTLRVWHERSVPIERRVVFRHPDIGGPRVRQDVVLRMASGPEQEESRAAGAASTPGKTPGSAQSAADRGTGPPRAGT